MSAERKACPRCGRTFADQNGLYCHLKMKHRLKSGALRHHRPQREPSMGSRVAEAMLSRACGEPVDPDIAEMFDVD